MLAGVSLLGNLFCLASIHFASIAGNIFVVFMVRIKP